MSYSKSGRPSLKVVNNQLKEDVWAADKLLKKRITKKRVVEYLVKWRGYGLQYASWEPESNLLDKRLIRDFNERYESSKKKSIYVDSADRKRKYSERQCRTRDSEDSVLSRTQSDRLKSKVGRPRKKCRIVDMKIDANRRPTRSSPMKEEDSSPSKLSATSCYSYKTASTEPLSTKDKHLDQLNLTLNQNVSDINNIPLSDSPSHSCQQETNLSPCESHFCVDRYSKPLKSKDNIVFTDVTSKDFTVTIKEVLPTVS